jgi:hypothetical protein
MMEKPVKNKKRLGNEGLTLIEMMIATGLSAVVILALSDLLINSYKSMLALQQQVDFDTVAAFARDSLTNPTTCKLALGTGAQQMPPSSPTQPLGTLGTGVALGAPIITPNNTLNTPLLTNGGSYGQFSNIRILVYNMQQFFNSVSDVYSSDVDPYFMVGVYLEGQRPSSYLGSSVVSSTIYTSVVSYDGINIFGCEQTLFRTGVFSFQEGASGTNIFQGSWVGYSSEYNSANDSGETIIMSGGGTLVNPSQPPILDLPGGLDPSFAPTPLNYFLSVDSVNGTYSVQLVDVLPIVP